MHKVLCQPIPLIDANQLSDEELKKQRWIGPLLAAMKHIRQKDMTNHAMKILASILWDAEKQEEKSLTVTHRNQSSRPFRVYLLTTSMTSSFLSN